MEYMFLINSGAMVTRPGTPEFEQMMGAWGAYNQMLMEGGHWVAGASPQAADTATTVALDAAAKPTITDGPFVETKEQLGGFYLVKAADLDEALTLASKVPLPGASIEVRPVMFRADA